MKTNHLQRVAQTLWAAIRGRETRLAGLCVLLLLGPGTCVANAAAIAPNSIDTMDGSTVSSPITFENFVAPSMALPGYTSVQFLFTIKDPCNGCIGSTDTSEVYYGPLVANNSNAAGIVTPFTTPCTFSVTIGTTFNPYPTVLCNLSTIEANPTSTGSFLYDLKNGGLSIVVACVEPGVASYTSGQCNANTNLNDRFFFAGAAGDTTNASVTLLPQTTSATPEPATGLILLLLTAVLGVLKLLHRSVNSYNFKRSPVIRG